MIGSGLAHQACLRAVRRGSRPLARLTWLGLTLALAVPTFAGDPEPQPDSAAPTPRESKSGYEDPGVAEGAKGVGGQLIGVHDRR